MITLRPMTEEEFQSFLHFSYESYADDLTAENPVIPREAAVKEAQSELKELLPQGLHTKNHFLFSIRNAQNEQVGYLWYDLLNPNKAFVDDLLIFPQHRRQGHAAQALHLGQGLHRRHRSRTERDLLLHAHRPQDRRMKLHLRHRAGAPLLGELS